MCILFVCVDNTPAVDGYQLIVANNRDEYYKRPTKPAARWENHRDCISGLDHEPGREGGTWIGLSEKGKFSSLLNILQNTTSPEFWNKKGRGFLVTDFLKGDMTAQMYTEPLATHRHDYNRFNLVILEKSHGKWGIHYFSSDDSTSPRNLPEGIHAFGNSSDMVPWKKVSAGKQIFNQIVNEHPSVHQKEEMTRKLFDMLSDKTQHRPDDVLERMAAGHLDEETTQQRSGVFVDSPQIQYGTRTHTVILIDGSGNGEYIERTMREPIQAHNPVWDTNTVHFKLQQ